MPIVETDGGGAADEGGDRRSGHATASGLWWWWGGDRNRETCSNMTELYMCLVTRGVLSDWNSYCYLCNGVNRFASTPGHI